MIKVTDAISIDESELEETFIRSSGPGGQNVNKVATAVQLRFSARHSFSLPEGVRARLDKLAGSRLTLEGEIVIRAERFRTLERNRADALERLVALIRRATIVPKTRRPTRPTLAAKRKRLESKGKRSEVKAKRGRPGIDD